MNYLRLFLAIYGAGIAGTFAWLFFTLSGATACASGAAPCQIVIGRTGQLALVWPAYWGGRNLGKQRHDSTRVDRGGGGRGPGLFRRSAAGPGLHTKCAGRTGTGAWRTEEPRQRAQPPRSKPALELGPRRPIPLTEHEPCFAGPISARRSPWTTAGQRRSGATPRLGYRGRNGNERQQKCQKPIEKDNN